MPGKVADFLRTAELEPAERATLDQGITVRRGQGYTLRVTAVLAVHLQLLDLCQVLDGTAALPAQRKARREYENRVNALRLPACIGGFWAHLGASPGAANMAIAGLKPARQAESMASAGLGSIASEAFPLRTGRQSRSAAPAVRLIQDVGITSSRSRIR
ncbi:hypothetical protein [Streptomyces sp. 147326]|uniref:hypothetical protein n=1 Tax=Streptomyces sp. 147326 TaxID=3074379 RepID=UPI003857B0EA